MHVLKIDMVRFTCPSLKLMHINLKPVHRPVRVTELIVYNLATHQIFHNYNVQLHDETITL